MICYIYKMSLLRLAGRKLSHVKSAAYFVIMLLQFFFFFISMYSQEK